MTSFIFNLPHNYILNAFFGFFSLAGMSVLVWLIIFAYLVFIEKKKDRQFIIYFLACLLISSLAFFTLKQLIKRERPLSQQYNNVTIEQLNSYPQDFSFPSGHSTTAFSAACILSFFDKKRKRYFYLIAYLIAFSRVYLGYHFLLDVLVGGLLGWAISAILIKLFSASNSKFKIKSPK